MTPTTIGDLAQTFLNRRADTRLTQALGDLSTELNTGLAADNRTALRGETDALSALERGLTLIDAYDLAASDARLLADSMQATAGRMRDRVGAVLPELTAVATGSDPSAVDAVAQEARQAFLGLAADLNTQIAGQSLFAGTAVTGPAVRDGGLILQDLVAALAGAATAQDVVDGIDTFFADFTTRDYLGAADPRDALRVGDGESVALATRADDPRIVDGLKVLARVAVLDMGVLGGDHRERIAVATGSVDEVLSAGREMIDLSAEIGSAQARIETATARNAGERSALKSARLDLLAADPYETATRLRETENQIDALYTLTARLSRLTLTSYL